ncbi:MAG: 3-hydroxyacyl-ACP dehydratase FabZ [bacterium]|nr:3-hydroxyacyl-ACP dehydratase FabZ [bacterium]
MINLDINQIMSCIPQRYPFLMVDRVIDLDPGKRVVAEKNVSINEHFFQGHFPADPIMPGVLIVEAMAQASMFLFYVPDQTEQKLDFYLAIVKDIRFLRSVLPGDQLQILVEAVRVTKDNAVVKVLATVKDGKVSEGELVFVRRK